MIIILVLALVLATSCKKDKPIEDTGFKDKKESAADDSKDVEDEEDEKTDNKKSAKAKPKKDLNYVKGGDVGSVSSYVEDREIWKGFSDDRHIAIAKRINMGVHLPRILLDSADADEANAEIDKMAEDLMGMYEKYKDEPENFEIGFYASFSTYQDEDLLSIKVSI